MQQRKINNRLWIARKSVQLSQIQVASILGHKSSAQISRWEKGKSIPPTKELLKLSALYNRLANDLMFDYFDELRNGVNERYRLLMAREKNTE